MDAVQQGLALMRHGARQDKEALQLELWRYWEATMAQSRYADPKRLLKYGFKVYSQCEEDGILQEIFARIGTETRAFVEFGVQRGFECNTVKLLVEGWRGLWIEAGGTQVEQMSRDFRPWLERGELQVIHSFVTAENIDELIGRAKLGAEIDLLSIDIDGNDYWVWQAIKGVSPRVVVIEYNSTFRPPLSVVVPYQPDWRWDGTNYFGASLGAMAALGEAKGYRLVGSNFCGSNAFFVRADLCRDRFLAPFTAAEHYEPPRYFYGTIAAGHPARVGPLERVGQRPAEG
jgi:hypothetical protein